MPFSHNTHGIAIVFIVLLIIDISVWIFVISSPLLKELEIHFFDVGQGDASLIMLPGGVEILIDGGPPNGRAIRGLDEALRSTDRYLDLVILSHPDLDHFGGLIDILESYDIGAFIMSGREGKASAYKDLIATLHEKEIPTLLLQEGDRIRYRNVIFMVLAPSVEERIGKTANDASLVLYLGHEGKHALFPGDIGAEVESRLARTYNISADLLKVPHHGSKFSSTAQFLNHVRSAVAIVSVGKNSYGHPTNEVLSRFLQQGAKVFRTDLHGTIRVVVGKNMQIFQSRH